MTASDHVHTLKMKTRDETYTLTNPYFGLKHARCANV